MHILLIKTSSMGDIIHTLPALTDAKKIYPNLQIDWVIEESFQSLPAMHPAVNRVIPVALRRWRNQPFSRATLREWRAFYRVLREKKYDMVLDAQGLLKSACITYLARATDKVGLDAQSAREKQAAWFYKKCLAVTKHQHAIDRLRRLFSLALQYPTPNNTPEYGLLKNALPRQNREVRPYIVFLHGTTWRSKTWPETYWHQLAALVSNAGFAIKMSGGTQEEVERAKRIATFASNVEVTPFLSIGDMAAMLLSARGVVAVDTGFAHLAAALDTPVITLYGATSASLTGTVGRAAENMIATFPSCTPCLKRECHYTLPSMVIPACYEALTPEIVWEKLINRCQQFMP